MKKNTKHDTLIPGIKDSFKFMGESHEEYEIPLSSYNKLFGAYVNPTNYTNAIYAIESTNRKNLELIYGEGKYPTIINSLVKSITPSFRYHGDPYNGWRLELSGRNVINNIYKYFGLDEVANVYNTSKHSEKVALEEDSKKILETILKKDLSEEEREFVQATIANINKITNINETKLDDDLRGKYEYKDLLFVIGFVSLENFKKTNNALYLNFAKKYYDLLTHSKYPIEWPHWFLINGVAYQKYENFRDRYIEVMNSITTKKEGDKKTPIRFGDSFIKAGSLGEEIEKTKTMIEKTKNDSTLTEANKKRRLDALNSLREKEELFYSLGANRFIYGTDEVTGYIGFEFDNITVFEKFYDGKGLSRPAVDNAIYWMQNDVMENMAFQNKQEILKYIRSKENPDAGRIIHDKNGNYKTKVKRLIKKDEQ